MGNGQKVKKQFPALIPVQWKYVLCMLEGFWLEVLLSTLVFDDFTKHDIPFEVELIFCSVNVQKRKE